MSETTKAQREWAGKTMDHVDADGLQTEMDGFSTLFFKFRCGSSINFQADKSSVSGCAIIPQRVSDDQVSLGKAR